MKIVVGIDSFKGCLTSEEAGNAVRQGLLMTHPDADITVLQIADGGEGTAEALHSYLGGQTVKTEVADPLGRITEASYIHIGDKAIVEMAQASGLTLLSQDERDVTATSTYGFGQLIGKAIEAGAQEIVCTLGGSATNDAGLGALQALGVRIFTADGEITRPVTGGDLASITGFDTTATDHLKQHVTLSYLYDADIDFFGPHGAALMYARQKGADEATCSSLDKAMARLASIPPFAVKVKGAGAAGGVGGGLHAFLDATPVKGIDAILDAAGFDNIIKGADMVITGEGSADSQTRQGKAARGILDRCRRLSIPVILMAGRVEYRKELLADGFTGIININNLSPYDNLRLSNNTVTHSKNSLSSYSPVYSSELLSALDSEANPLDPRIARLRLILAASRL